MSFNKQFYLRGALLLDVYFKLTKESQVFVIKSWFFSSYNVNHTKRGCVSKSDHQFIVKRIIIIIKIRAHVNNLNCRIYVGL